MTQWVLTNTRALDSGPITTAGKTYAVVNPEFDLDLGDWTQVQGEWSWDGSNVHGHWHPGSATVILDGDEKELRSTQFDVVPDAHLNASVWVSWEDLAVGNNLIQNGDFATDLSHWFNPTRATWDGTQGHIANGSLKITCNGEFRFSGR